MNQNQSLIIGSDNANLNRLQDSVLLRIFNSQKSDGHLALGICRNDLGEIIAIKCNCCNEIYHPLVGKGIHWGIDISKYSLSAFKKCSLGEMISFLSD
jgi:hypothetical protein